ncbi:Mitogen-activated protein kinase 15 [Geodia barretti]|uniref:Mitogen-activated protein kinase n=1 Tax=Geodia barretti TaxID=519541 RepID=A0AA35X413_GEOBA|nr:Mitogen-activated protein kinase 15 [Geodia barretti]
MSTTDVEEHVLRNYEIRRRIGKGAYGIVWKSVDRRTGEIVALKKIFDAFSNATDAQRTYREVMFLQAFSSHENVVQLLNVVRAANDVDLYLVFEFMDTDLHAVVKNRLLQPIHHQYIMYQLLKVMKFIHSGHCIHRDLKPSNILINPHCHIKLADFGLARSLSLLPPSSSNQPDVSLPAMTDYVATRWYRAPEILLGGQLYTTGVDMWSTGCILAEMIAGRPLFPGSSTMNQIERIMAVLPQPSRQEIEAVGAPYAMAILGQLPRRRNYRLSQLLPTASDEALDLLTKLLQFTADRRLSAHSAVHHPFVKRFHDARSEPVLDCDVVLHLDDNTQLAADRYRDRLYTAIAGRDRG